jgi:hypothetical protein
MTAVTISMNTQVISSYGEGPNILEAAIADLPQTGLDHAFSGDSWTIRMIVHHIADGDAIWKSFICQALGNVGGEFRLQWYWEIPQDDWAKRWNYARRPIEPSLAVFRANRSQTIQLLEHTPDALKKTLLIRWPNGKEQEVSVLWVVEMQTRHVLEHEADISRIRKMQGI